MIETHNLSKLYSRGVYALRISRFASKKGVRLRTNADPAAVEALATTAAQLPGVADIRYDRQWIQRLMHAGAREKLRTEDEDSMKFR